MKRSWSQTQTQTQTETETQNEDSPPPKALANSKEPTAPNLALWKDMFAEMGLDSTQTPYSEAFFQIFKIMVQTKLVLGGGSVVSNEAILDYFEAHPESSVEDATAALVRDMIAKCPQDKQLHARVIRNVAMNPGGIWARHLGQNLFGFHLMHPIQPIDFSQSTKAVLNQGPTQPQ